MKTLRPYGQLFRWKINERSGKLTHFDTLNAPALAASETLWLICPQALENS
jgi:hypothetical protein